MDFINCIFLFEREELTISAEQVINRYQELLAVLKSDQFGEYLRKELNKSYPEYLEVLKKRIEDMNTADHGIVIAGTTYQYLGHHRRLLRDNKNIIFFINILFHQERKINFY